MTIDIDLKEYLTEDDIRRAAMDTLYTMFREHLRTEADIERVLSNLTSEYIFTAVCKALDKDMDYIASAIAKGVDEAIKSDHIKYQVFRRKDLWDRSESPAVKILDDVLKESRPLIEEQVRKRIEQYDFRELEDSIEDTIYGVICGELRGRQYNKEE